MHLVDATETSILLNSSDDLYTVHSGLNSGTNYTVLVKALSIVGTTETRQQIFISEQLFYNTTQVTNHGECFCNTTQTNISEFF